ncbi:hypothetical protein [Leucobacter chinensis]|uniref:hypothetical protein n=1 Tax=Leucobacter chinensis TaxID=2851010 RepID=UPI001C21C7E1|nr:hypothetical protein [Leucobacter chinensis]
MSTPEQHPREEADLARVELYETLSLLSDRLNYAQRFDDAVERTTEKLQEERKTNPVGFALAVAGVAATVGVLAWVGASKIIRKFQ